MTDSISVFEPGFRIPDTAGNPLPGAVVYFFDAGTSDPKTVYADKDLTVELGTSITCDSAGYPSASSARVQIYTGTDPYKIVCTDADAVTQWTHDDVRGATDTSIFLTSTTLAPYTITSVNSTGTWTKDDITGHVFEANATAGNFVRTLPAAVDCQGLAFDVVSVGTGITTLLAAGSDLIGTDGVDTARKALLLQTKGDGVRMISNGVGWRAIMFAKAPQALKFSVEDSRTAPAGSPVVGGFYLLNGAPSGAFTTTAPACAANDIVMYDGQANYQIYRPFTDCGWSVFDKATNIEYTYRDSTWVALNDRITYASAAEIEAHTVANKPISTDLMHRHPGVAKATCQFTGTTGAIRTGTGYNVSSVTRSSAGVYSVAFTAAMATADYIVTYGADPSGAVLFAGIRVDTKAVGSFSIITTGVSAGPTATIADMDSVDLVVFGDMA